MRPITVTAGPMPPNAGAAASIGSAVPSGPAPQQALLNQTPAGGSNVSSWVGTATVQGNLLTVASTTSGAMSIGRLVGAGLPPNITVTGPGPTGGTWLLSQALQAPIGAAQAMRLNTVVTLDAPRQISVGSTSDPPGAVTYTVYGTNAAGQPIQETLVSNGSSGATAPQTTQYFATVTQVVIIGGQGNLASIGTSVNLTSPWVMFDPYVDVASITKSVQISTTGAPPTWSVQITDDDPNSPTNPVPASLMNWQPDPDATFSGATAAKIGSWAFVPLWARLLLTGASPAGSWAAATFVQQGGNS